MTERRVWEDGPRVVLILAIVVSALFIPWPWNLVVVLCGAIVWGRKAAARCDERVVGWAALREE